MLHLDHCDYENELSIDPKLLCAICLHPFNKPKLTLCDHMFCHDCIELWYKKSVTCPLCRQLSKKKYLRSVKNSHILHPLTQLQVKCLLCQQTGIKRKDFDQHIDHQCAKVIVSCSAHDMKCSWRGKREDLQSHQMICSQKSNLMRFIQHTRETRIPLMRFTDSHRLRLENLINQCPKNGKVTLRNQQLTDADISIVIQSAIVNRRCKILDLGNNRIISYGVLQLAESLPHNNTLKMLSLHQNSVLEKSIEYLANKLALNNSMLKWLDLESTDLTDHSAEYLASMLATNTSLTGLWLSNNKIGYDGIAMLASVLAYSNRTLRYLDLENNPKINDACLDCLMNMIEQNLSLKTVYLNHCALSIGSKTILRDLANTKQGFRLFL